MTKDNRPISEVIRERIDQDSWFANDNISKYINDGETDLLIDEVAEKFKEVLKSLVINIELDHNTNDTARRVAKMFINETFSGRYVPMPRVTDFPNAKKYDSLYTVGPIKIRSTCAHHFAAITGNCWIGIFPGEKVIGLSKFNRIADWVASRPQIQEELTEQIANEIENITEAKGIAVIIKAEHLCMTHRGVKEHESEMVTSVMRGMFREDKPLKSEFLALINMNRK